ncbi:MAG: FKBP-type peptidyl-prolyl cis-trans isomerase [Flavobacteriales bacterium]|nr:FKBP-type peptidyl-prolyl cis-trans isomerase [Flavobacteriales bacterium]
MRRGVLPVIAICLLAACGPSPLPGGSRVSDGVYWRLNTLGEGERFPTDSDSVMVRVRMSLKDAAPGSLFSTERWYGMAGAPGAADYFTKLHSGDSATVLLQAGKLPWAEFGAIRPASAVDTMWIELELAMRAMRSLEQSRMMQEALLQARTELDEDSILGVYLADTAQHWRKAYGLWYSLAPDAKQGARVSYGELVTIAYTATFLDNGKVFDKEAESTGGLTFRLGDPGQVVKGMEIATSLLPRKGGHGRFILPSDLAFGPTGSSSGIVPPWTPVLYEVSVLPPKPDQTQAAR